ncbi:hypothetical protein PGB90_008955 [Kerria lacca]
MNIGADSFTCQSGKTTGNRRKIPETTLIDAKAHLEKLPSITSHYTRLKLKYLQNPRLTVKKLYKIFREYYAQKNHKPLKMSLHSYYYFFKRSGYRIRKPLSDVCNFCIRAKLQLKHKNDLQLKAKYDLHQVRIRRYYKEKKELIQFVRIKYDHLVLECDYSQNFAILSLNCNKQFYIRLLWLFVFNIHCHNDNRFRMYHFLETESIKGSNNVASFIYDGISTFIEPETTVRRKVLKYYNIYTREQYVRIIKSALIRNRFEVINGQLLIRDWTDYLLSKYAPSNQRHTNIKDYSSSRHTVGSNTNQITLFLYLRLIRLYLLRFHLQNKPYLRK